MPGVTASSSSATVRSCTAEFWRRSMLARWKPKQSIARCSRRRRPCVRIVEPFLRRESLDDRQVREDLGGLGIGRHRPRRGVLQALQVGVEPAHHAENRPLVGLVLLAVAQVLRALGQGKQVGRHADHVGAQRQLVAQVLQFAAVEGQRLEAVHAGGRREHVGGDERVAVAVAADPAAHSQERGDRLARLVVGPKAWSCDSSVR